MNTYLPHNIVRKSTIVFTLLCLSLLFVGKSWGQTNVNATWISTSSNAWLTGSNWSAGVYPGLIGTTSNTNVATFNSIGTTTTANINMNTAGGNFSLGAINIDASRTIALGIGNSSGSLPGNLRLYGTTVNSITNTILRNNGTATLTLVGSTSGGGTMSVVFGNTTANVVNIDGTGNIAISSNISGSGLLFNSTNSGNLNLSGTNTFTGGVIAGATGSGSGRVRFDLPAALPTTGTLRVNTAGSMRLLIAGTYGATTQNLELNPTQTTSPAFDLGFTTGTATWQGTLNLLADSRIEAATGTTLIFSGNVSGIGKLIKQAGGTVTLSGTGNTNTGGVQIGNGTLTVSSGSSLGTGDVNFFQTSANNTAITLNNAAQTIGNLTSSFTAVTGTQTQTFTLNGTALTINQNANTTFGDGAVNTLTSSIAGTGSVIKTGTGALTLSSSNTYTGGTTISAGSIVLAKGDILDDNGTLTLNGGTFSTGTASGFNETIGTLKLTGNSTVALATGVHALHFAASSSIAWTSGKILTITGWSGTAGASGTSGQIFVGGSATSLTAAQLAQIAFAGYAAGATQLASGEIVPAIGATPSITPTLNTLTGFTYIQGAGPSASQSFTLSAANLTAGGGTITITGSADYEVSSDNTTFGGTATLSYTGTGTLAASTVYVRLKAGLTQGGYNNETIAISGGGASSSVTVSGSVTAAVVAPVVTSASPTGTYGTSFTYTIQATNNPTSYAITSGTLPAGLSLDQSTGIISGTPTTVVSSSVVGVSATNTGGTGNGTLTFTISPKALTVSGLSVTSKTYDGTTTATLSGIAALNGVVGSDNVTLSGTPSANFADANVGTAKPVTVTGYTLSGTAAGNYTLTQPAGLTGNITVKPLTITGLSGTNKVYDGTATATLSGTPTLTGIVGSDNVTLSGTPTATFTAGASVGTGKAITVSGYTLSGTSAGNYTVTQPTGLTADITAKPLTITGITANNKTYDGTTTATLTGTATLNGVVSADAANVTLGGTPSANFADANVGIAKPVTVTGYTISGTAAGNYTLAQPTGLTADITPGTCGTTTTGAIVWNFGTSTGSAVPSSNSASNVTVSGVSIGNSFGAVTTSLTTVSPSSGYTGASGAYNIGNAARTGALVTAVNSSTGSAYFEFTLTPSSGYSVSLTGMSFGSRSTGTGAAAYSVRSSLDNYASDLATGSLSTASTWILYSTSLASTTSASGTAITYRIYGYNGTGNPGSGTINWKIDDLSLSVGVTQPTPLTSPATATTCSGTVFNYTPTSSLSGATYTWTRAVVTGISNAAGSGTGNISETLVNTTSSPINVVYSYIITTANCTSPNQTVTVTVNPAPNVSNFSTSATSPINAGSVSTVTISSTSLAAGSYTVGYDLSGANTTTGATASVTVASGSGTFTVPAASLSNAGNTIITINTIANGTCPATLTTGNTATIVVVTPSIATGTINGSPFCAGGTSGNTVSIPFTSTGTFASGNTYTAQLSDAGGSFASPVNLANPVTSTANSGTINTTIPAGTAAGTGYRIRVVSSNPAVTGADNGTNLVINQAVTPSVTVSANPGSTICAGTSVTFTATAINGGTSPTYDFQVNGVSQQNSASNTYTNSSLNNGDVVRVIITSNETCITSATAASAGITMTVNPNVAPTVSVAANPGSTICAGTSVTFTAAVTNQGTSPIYDFQVNNISQQSGASNTFTTTALNNNDVVTVVLTSNATCAVPAIVTSNSITITVNPNLTPSVSLAVSPSSTICAGTSVTFTATPTNGGANPLYDFQVNGISKQNNATNTYTTTSLNNGDVVKVVITSNAVCAVPATATSSSITMTVNPNVTPTVLLSDNSGGTFCAGTSVTFTATATNPGTSPNYDFRVDGASVQSSASNTYTTATLTNGQQVTVILTSNATCATTNTATSNTITVSVTSNATPSVTLAANPAGTICAGTSVTFTATPASGGSTPNYDFRVNGVSVQSSASNTYTTTSLADGNTVDVVLTSTLTCTTTPTATSNVITASVTTPVTPSVSIAPSANPVCAGTPVIFTATPINGGTSPTYQWYLNNQLVNGVTGATYNAGVLNNGDQVYAVVTTSLTCVTSATATSNTVAETVNPYATIALSSAAGTDNQSAIQGNPITNITYTVTGGTGATLSAGAFPTGVTGVYSSGTYTISGTPTVAGTFTYTITTTSTAGCNNSASGTITVCAIPAQASSITFPNTLANSAAVNWTNGTGTGRVVFINTTNSFANPVNSTTALIANPVYTGSGQQVVYNGSSNSVTVSGLDASSTYWFRIYEYNNCSGTFVYNTDTSLVVAANGKTTNPLSVTTKGAPLTQSNFTSVLTPQYTASGTSSRMPVMFRATVTGLLPNKQYRYYAEAATASTAGGGTADFGTTNSGAGNPLLVNSVTSAYFYTSSPSFATPTMAGVLPQYDSLVTDASGNFTGWFGFVNTGNARFTAGNFVYPTITLGNNNGTTLYRRVLNDSLKVLSFSTISGAASGGSLLKSKTNATPKNLVAIFDNTSAGGRPLAITPVEYIAEAGSFLTNRPSLYDSSNGAWNAIIPNNNANGVQAIEQLSVTTGNLVGCIATDADGQWATGRIKTSNPANGLTTALVIAGVDDPLATCPVYPTTAIQQGATAYANNSTYTYANTVVNTNNDITFTINNAGSGPLTISSLTVTSAVTGVFTLQGTAPTTVAAGGSASFVVRFKPNSAAIFTGKITLNTNDTAQANNPYVVNLSGTGYYVPVISVSQGGTSYPANSTYTYPNTIVGSSTDATFTITNSGGAALNISSLAVSGTDYSLVGTAPTTVAANSSATFMVRFAPTSAGLLAGMVTINSDDPNQGTYIINLNGTGTNTVITTGTISGSPFCISASAGEAVSVPFTYTPVDVYTSFTAQLSDGSGSFTSPAAIGNVTSDGSGSQIISANIPAGTAAGNNYRVRVISTWPAVTGSTSSSVLVISNPVTPSVSITRSPSAATICSGSPVTFTATPVNGGSTPAYQWYDGGVLVPNVTGNTYTVNAPVDGEQVYTVLTTSVSCYTTLTATSNTITLSVTNPIVITLTSGAGSDAQTVTQGVAIDDITYAVSGGPTTVTLSGTLPTGVTGSYNAGVYTISGTPTQTGTFNYTINATGGCNNNPTVSGSITVSTARIILANNGMQPGIKNITTGSTKNVLSTFQITNNLATTTTLTQVKAPLSSNYKAADIAGFKLYTNTVNDLTSAAQLGVTQASSSTGTGETVTFGSISQTLAVNTTYYYWLTADITSNAATGDSIIASANPASNFTFSGAPSVTGSVSKAGAQIIASGAVAPGLLAVLRLGNGTTAPSASSLPVNIYQYNQDSANGAGALLKTMPTVPTYASGANRALVQSATATSEGALSLSGNGRLLTFAGYNDTVGDANVAKVSTVDAVIGKLDAYLNFSTNTSLNRAKTYSGNNFRTAVTVDGKSYWTGGPVGTGGIRYIPDGAYSDTGIQISGLNTRVLNIYNNQLYASAQSGLNTGVSTVGSGLPTTAATATLLSTVNAPSAYSFVFLNTNPASPDPDLLYVAGIGNSGQNGIFKYYKNGATWISAGSGITTTSVFGITGTVDISGGIILYATTNPTASSSAKPSQLVKYQDNSKPNATINLSTGAVLATATTSTSGPYAFGGVAFTPTANGDTTISTSGVQLSGIYRNVTIANGGSATLTGNVKLLGSAVVQAGGTLDCGAYTISSYSASFRTYFSVDSLGTLITSNPAGFDSVGVIGSIQTSVFNNATTGLKSRRNFSSGANYVYTAPIAQSSGIALPAVLNGNLTINADDNVTFSNSKQTINGTLTLTSGKLVLPTSDTLTLGGGVTHTNGSITANNTSNLILNGSASKALSFTSTGNTIHNLTVNSSASAVSLDNSLNITAGTNYGTVICNGAMNTNGYLTLKSDEQGTAAVGQSAGTITGDATVERFTNGNLNQGQSRRAWRFMTSPVINGQNIHHAWQENGNDNTGYGTLITGENFPDAATAASQGYDFTGAGFHASIKHFIPASSGGGSWQPLNSDGNTNGTLVPVRDEQAYMLYVRGNRTIGADLSQSSIAILRAKGGLLQGNQTVPLSIGKFTVVGNPYASSIDFGSLFGHNSSLIQNQFYLWNSKLSTYGAYVLVRQNPDSSSGIYQAVPSALAGFPRQDSNGYRYIPSGSGFFVTPATGVTSGNVAIQESDKAAGNVPPISPFRIVSTPTNVRQLYVNLNLKDSDTSATLADGFAAMFSPDYEGNEEDNSSAKIYNFNENLNLVRGGKAHIIEARDEVKKTDTLYMKMWFVTKRNYQLQMKGDNFTSAPGIQAWLEDNYLKIKQSVDLSGGITTVNFAINTDSLSASSDRFRIVFENNASALPVTITKVKAAPSNGGVNVSWTVANEVNIKGYTIEKSADGGRTFTGMGTEQAAHNNPQAAVTSYSGYDATPKVGDNFYRIRIEGKDGSITYSEIVKVTVGDAGSGIEIVVYPNPVRDGKVNLQLSNLKTGTYLVGVYSGSGQTVYQKQVTIAQPNTTQSEPLLIGNSLAQGSYQIKISDRKGVTITETQVIISR